MTKAGVAVESASRRSLVAVTGEYHGLGNRVRAVLGCRVLARHEGRDFAYVWPTGRHFGAGMDRLWDFDQPTMSPLRSRMLSLRYPYRDNRLEWVDDAARAERVWQIRTPHALLLPASCPAWEDELRRLRPSRDVAARVRDTFSRGLVGRPYVGVMIRTNPVAHQQTLTHSPLSWFLGRMREIRDRIPDCAFYISADTPEASRRVTEEFDGCFGRADKGAYNSESALIESVVDLYLLASSSHLLGPHYSSFPELAQILAGDGLELETSMRPPSVPILERLRGALVDDPTRPSKRAPGVSDHADQR